MTMTDPTIEQRRAELEALWLKANAAGNYAECARLEMEKAKMLADAGYVLVDGPPDSDCLGWQPPERSMGYRVDVKPPPAPRRRRPHVPKPRSRIERPQSIAEKWVRWTGGWIRRSSFFPYSPYLIRNPQTQMLADLFQLFFWLVLPALFIIAVASGYLK
jgi:hypothetical protein